MKKLLPILFLLANVIAYSQSGVVSLPNGGIYRSQFIDSIVTSPGKPYPVLSGMDVVNTGWTSVGSGTFSKVIAHNISINTNPANANYHMIQVVEVDTAYEKTHPVTAFNYLFQAFSLTECQATPGSYYNAELSAPTISTTVYLHPTTGTPGANKYRYEVTTRNYVIAGSTNDAFIANVNNARYENLWLRSNGNGYGMIAAGDSAHIKNMLFQGGGTHDIVLHSGTIDNATFLSGCKANGIALTFYELNAGGNIDSLTNSRFYDLAAPFGMHNGGDTFTRARRLFIQKFKAFNNTTAGGLTALINSGVDTSTVDGAYIENYQAGYIPSATVEIAKDLILKDIWQSGVQYYPTGTGHLGLSNTVVKGKGTPTNQSNVAGGILTMFRSQNSNAQQDVTNNIFWPKTTWHPSGTPGQPGIAAVIYDVLANNHSGQTGFINALHNIYIADNPAGDTVLVHNTGNFYADSNVYVILKGAGFVWRSINYGPAQPGYINRTDTLTYDFGRYDIGYARPRDPNSIVIDLRNDPRGLKAIFVDPDNGDFRLAKTAEADRVSLLKAGLTTPILQWPVREDVDFLTYAPVVYSPSRETGVQKPIGASGFATDGRTQLHDTINNTYRDYLDTSEVFVTLNTAEKRKGGFPIYIRPGATLLDGVLSGGIRHTYWFRNGVENFNLEETKTDGPSADEFKDTTDALKRGIGAVAAKILPFPSSLAYTNAANTFAPLQTLNKGLKLYQDINGRFLTIGAPQVGDILYGDFPTGNYYAMKFSQTAQCNTCYVEWSGNPTGNLATPIGLRIHSNGGIGLNVAIPEALLDVNGSTKIRSLTAGPVFSDGGGTLYTGTNAGGSGGSSVTSFSAGAMSPLFTTGVATPTTTPTLSFSLNNAPGLTVFGRALGSGAPSYIGLDTTFIAAFSQKVRSLFSIVGGTYNDATGQFTVSGGGVSSYDSAYTRISLLQGNKVVYDRHNPAIPSDTVQFSGGASGAFTLTTTGTSGPSTLINNTLNIPQYAGGTSGTGGDVYQAGNNTFTGTNTFSGLTFSGSPTLSAGTFITITNGIYAPVGNIYADFPINARGGMQNDVGAVLQIYGGTSKRTNFNGGTASFDTPHFITGLDIVYKQHLDTLLAGIIPSQTNNAGKFLTTNGSAISWATIAGGTGGGDASTNTTSSIDGEAVLFSGTGGKTLRRSTGTGIARLTSGVLSSTTITVSDLPLLTGFTSAAGTVTASDSYFSAIQKLSGNISLRATQSALQDSMAAMRSRDTASTYFDPRDFSNANGVVQLRDPISRDTFHFAHLIVQGTNPSVSVGSASGTGATASYQWGKDAAFVFAITTGTSPSAGTIATITPGAAFHGANPIVIIQSAINYAPNIKANFGAGVITISSTTPLTASSNYSFQCIVVDY